jgi:BlaI family penicillinase repressor
MRAAPKITETEWEIMRVIWTKHPVTATEVIDQLSTPGSSWHPKTTRTLLSRLVKKKALRSQAEGRSYVYEPLVTEEQCIASASESFLDRVFGGSLKPMLAFFLQQQKLTREELKELSDLLEQKEKTGRNRK